MVKHLPTMRKTWVWALGREVPLEKEMAIHSSILAWKIPWMEEPGRLQSMGSQRVGHDWATSLHLIEVIPEWSSGFPYFLQLQSEFGSKDFMIWATVSSRSCFCWLYRASPSLAPKNIISLISVLTIFWCSHVESLGFSYLGCGVSLHGCSSKAQPLLLTLEEGYLFTAAPLDLERRVAPLGPPHAATTPWLWGCSSQLPPLTLGMGYLFTAAPAKRSHCSLLWMRGISFLFLDKTKCILMVKEWVI